jgi:hypothetical protein
MARVEKFIHESQNLYASGLEKSTYMQRHSEGAGEWCNHLREQYTRGGKINNSNWGGRKKNCAPNKF